MIYPVPRNRSAILARRRFSVNSTSFSLAILAICFAGPEITSKRAASRAPIPVSGNRGAFRTADLMLSRGSSNTPAMKSILGIAIALCVAAAFGFAYWLSVRPGASWLDGQWLFLIALPYSWTSLHALGAAYFSPDETATVAAAFVFDIVAAFLAGALIEALARWLWRVTLRRRSRA